MRTADTEESKESSLSWPVNVTDRLERESGNVESKGHCKQRSSPSLVFFFLIHEPSQSKHNRGTGISVQSPQCFIKLHFPHLNSVFGCIQ